MIESRWFLLDIEFIGFIYSFKVFSCMICSFCFFFDVIKIWVDVVDIWFKYLFC